MNECDKILLFKNVHIVTYFHYYDFLKIRLIYIYIYEILSL